jgi:uncharacterized membrane protein YhaH (DUF805 family)
MEWFLIVVRDNYSNFNGRASRKEYWMFYLFYMIFAIFAMVADNILGITFTVGEGYYAVNIGYGWIYLLFVLALLIPGLAVGIRRLHDVGKSGWWLLISLIPLIGAIWIIVLLATDGTADNNIYGPTLKTAPNTTDETVQPPTPPDG